MDARPAALTTLDPRTDRSPATTSAAVWDGPTGGVQVVRVPVPALRAGEVLVEIDLATVCGSDRHTVSGRRPGPAPSVLGHEAVGRVVEVGPGGAAAADGSQVAAGDRVVWGIAVSCGDCDRCRSGRTAKCRRVRKVGHEPFHSSWPLSGTYARHIALPRGAVIVPAPTELADEVAAPAACATATVMAALEAAGPVAGRRTLVSGCGMLGLAATAALRDAGAATIAVTDPSGDRRRVALAMGADTAHGTDERLPPVDVAIEVSGAASAVTGAFATLALGGVLVLAGSVSPGPQVLLDPERVVRQWLTVRGVHNYEPRHLQQAIDLLVRTRSLDWSGLVEPAVALTDLTEILTGRPGIRPRAAVRP